MNTDMDSTEAPPRTGSLPPPSLPPMRGVLTRSDAPPVNVTPAPEPSVFDPISHTAPPGFSPDKAVAEQLAALDNWATANDNDARRGAMRFWLLKGPAFVC